MARINLPSSGSTSRLIQHRRGGSSSKISLCNIRRFISFVLFALVLPLLLLLNHIIVISNNNISISPLPSTSKLTASNNYTATEGRPNDNNNNNKPIQIAYAISLIRCSDFQSSTSGLLDAATILRHSVHKTSIRNPNSGSKYDYKLYAIVHTKAKDCSHILSDLGYEVILKDSPVDISEIKGEYLRKNVHKEWCCGADEFVKLYAYTINQHPIVVHTDIDFMYYQPMDDVFDAMLEPYDSTGGKMARGRIEMEYPEKIKPNNIQAYLTRDYHQVIPGRKAGKISLSTVLGQH